MKHADNILVHQRRIKLADFGLSKNIAEPTSITKEMLGVVPYIDPKSFNNQHNVYLNQDNHYSLNKKSDIYSIGVIMWLISSGRKPFYRFYPEGVKYDISLVLGIRDGNREKIVSGTPAEYSNLYTSK
jgi:serine/threonine protein kinase